MEAWHPFANLARATPAGEVVWAAEPPRAHLKCWTTVAIRGDEVVANAWAHRRVVDPGTGRIIRSELTK